MFTLLLGNRPGMVLRLAMRCQPEGGECAARSEVTTVTAREARLRHQYIAPLPSVDGGAAARSGGHPAIVSSHDRAYAHPAAGFTGAAIARGRTTGASCCLSIEQFESMSGVQLSIHSCRIPVFFLS